MEIVAPSPDSELCDRLRRGDRAAFRDLYGRFAQSTFRFLVRLAGRRDLAEDLHQETWLRVARNAGRLRPDGDLAPWTFAIARNVFVSSRRRGGVRAAADEASARELTYALSPDADPACHDLERALAGLAEPHREILLLVGVEGLEIAHAAAVLELRADAARQRLARARAALAEALDTDAAQPMPRKNEVKR